MDNGAQPGGGASDAVGKGAGEQQVGEVRLGVGVGEGRGWDGEVQEGGWGG